ncbi:MAG: hypothetical protein EA376_14350 [Phycisphaeraceae bacterium]|nr:MAG: hypothetical protein EA376_14350 [Phycisphaeraceae bacterium]
MAFTLVDMMVAITIMAIVIAVAMPTLSPDEGSRLIGGARMLASDLEYAQSVSLANPADVALVRFREDGDGYWLARESDPETPMLRPGFSEEAYEIIFGEGRAALLHDMTISLDGVTDNTLTFDAFARLTTLDDAVITLQAPTRSVDVTVSSSTGSVRIQ